MRVVCERASRNCHAVLSSVKHEMGMHWARAKSMPSRTTRECPQRRTYGEHAFVGQQFLLCVCKTKMYENDLHLLQVAGSKEKIFEISVDLARSPSLEFACFHERGICLGQLQ